MRRSAGGNILLLEEEKKHKSAIKKALIIQRKARGFFVPNNLLGSSFNYLFSFIKKEKIKQRGRFSLLKNKAQISTKISAVFQNSREFYFFFLYIV